MHFISVFLLSISANVDNLAVGIAYGFKKIKIGLSTNLFIAFISALGTYLATSVGEDINKSLNKSVANFIGSAVIVGIGVWVIRETLKRERKRTKMLLRMQQMQIPVTTRFSLPSSRAVMEQSPAITTEEFSQEIIREFSYATYIENPAKADIDKSGYIDVRESIALAFGLTFNNLGSGIGAGISEVNLIVMTLVTFIFSVLAITGGYVLGDRFTTRLSGFWAGTISGFLMIATGIYEYFVV
ncbi:MAG: manganese efflux pump [Pelatocladus maniniholoensis HA4357-MV3]|jgi:putative Mn2+ efflux pump MntP|uniref:Manganese efflux pump n=1 Tax=Pelatocladus maniniholoensis HA4357-MV3 TaxID=1117104 RepID=A0A9E3H4P2_9NOST|nr:manganese efflux pump [Pelatocladus maniniholoensis HA4357-MV3]BAZ70646.1 manganese efflux pump MntP [Fischerella sp. NIES-4106]